MNLLCIWFLFLVQAWQEVIFLLTSIMFLAKIIVMQCFYKQKWLLYWEWNTSFSSSNIDLSESDDDEEDDGVHVDDIVSVMQIHFYWSLLDFLIPFNLERFSVSSLLSERTRPRGALSISSLCSALCSNPAMTGVINLQSELRAHTHTRTHSLSPRQKKLAVNERQTLLLEV